jgi:hypothetical protein
VSTARSRSAIATRLATYETLHPQKKYRQRSSLRLLEVLRCPTVGDWARSRISIHGSIGADLTGFPGREARQHHSMCRCGAGGQAHEDFDSLRDVVIAGGLCSGGGEEPADLVLLHGRIVTVDADLPAAQAIAARGARIVAVGSDAEIEAVVYGVEE